MGESRATANQHQRTSQLEKTFINCKTEEVVQTHSIGSMLETIHGMCDTRDLTDWENKFVKSCVETCGPRKLTVNLSSKQVEIIEQIYEKLS